MALFRPIYTDKNTGEKKKSNVWWYEFTYAGKPIRESAKTTRKTIAAESQKRRRLELEKTLAGMPLEKRENRINSVADVVKTYRERYVLDHRGRKQSILFSKGRLAHVNRLLGTMLLPDVTEDVVRGYMNRRIEEGVGGRTVNMEMGELSRAIGKPWSVLWPKVRKQEERKDVGRALSLDEEDRLIEAAAKKKRWKMGETMIHIALATGMRSGEIINLTWQQVDFEKRMLTVGRAKTASGTGREIPISTELFVVLSAHADWFTKKFEQTKPEHYLFPFGKPQPTDPSRPATTLKTVWKAIREEAKVSCRLHDLRHTALTNMAEDDTPEGTLFSTAGHLSRAMMERYSHIRIAAKRKAVEATNRNGRRRKSEGALQESLQVTATAKIN